MKKQVKYSYCINENNQLVHIKEITNETRHNHKLLCLECGQEMVANLGTKKAWYFSHKANTACNGESYLHKLAKRKIREKFLSSDSFPITFTKNVPCNQKDTCPFYHDSSCKTIGVSISRDLKIWKDKTLYDTCQEECKVGEFRPDLLLSYSKEPERPLIFIEIYISHKSEESKLKSGYKIIETTQLRSEDDIEDIISRGFVEEERGNCILHNFNPELPSIKKDDVPIERFVLFKNGAARVYKAHDYIVYCEDLHRKLHPDSAYELNLKEFGVELWGENVNNNTLNSYESGLIYLIKKKGLSIKNCFLCKYRKYNDAYDRFICIRYKSLGPNFKFPKQTMAANCHYYELDPDKMNHPLSELEKICSEVENT